MLLAWLVAAPSAFAFQPLPADWPQASQSFRRLFNFNNDPAFPDAFLSALNEWTADTPFNWQPSEQQGDPCFVPSGFPRITQNAVGFSNTICGTEFGSSTLAVTVTYSNGRGDTLQSSIVFNDAKSWGVFDTRTGPATFDFRRVALHELGHALGLDHEGANVAIMRPNYSTTVRTLQWDDIEGVAFIYDLDFDGIQNESDSDRDGDGIPNNSDSFPDDTDNDGTDNRFDTDDDNDGITDALDPQPLVAAEPDNDGDGIPDSTDPDDDNDGVPDVSDAFPFDPNESADADGDGLGDNADPDDDNDGVPDAQDPAPLDPTIPGVPEATVPALPWLWQGLLVLLLVQTARRRRAARG